jgi:hypothetical protein
MVLRSRIILSVGSRSVVDGLAVPRRVVAEREVGTAVLQPNPLAIDLHDVRVAELAHVRLHVGRIDKLVVGSAGATDDLAGLVHQGESFLLRESTSII